MHDWIGAGIVELPISARITCPGGSPLSLWCLKPDVKRPGFEHDHHDLLALGLRRALFS